MTKMLVIALLLGVSGLIPSGPAWARKPAPAKTTYRWERMSVVRVMPSQVFARLGLTHSTRYGYTRDGFTKKTPDPTFPPGLTDVVPYDATHLLLVRGTAPALAQFRARVLATENDILSGARWHVSAQLLTGAAGEPLGPALTQDVAGDLQFTVTAGDPAGPRVYRLRLHANADATAEVTCQSCLSPLPSGGAREVWTPGQIWSPAVTRPVLTDGTVTFEDRASDRQAARRRLAMPDDADAQDYQLRVTAEAPRPAVQTPTEGPATADLNSPATPAAPTPSPPKEGPDTPPQ